MVIEVIATRPGGTWQALVNETGANLKGKPMFSTHAEIKAAEAAAIEGLAGKERQAAKKAFYEANKAAIRAVLDGNARAEFDAYKAKIKTAEEKAASLGMLVTVKAESAGASAWLVTGKTFDVKDILRAHGGRWHAASKGWLFSSDASLCAAMAAL